MKDVLVELGYDVWLKWPNDFYLKDDKIGGTITQKVDRTLICGIGINLKNSQNGYKALNSDIEAIFLLKLYIDRLMKFPKWKHVFMHYEVEFEHSMRFSVHIDKTPQSLQNALLCEDGSLIIDGKRVFSLR